MSKIAEQKALEAYPKRFVRNDFLHIDGDANYDFRIGFIKGYDQAMQDFFEKAERYLQNTLYDRVEIKVFGTLIPTIVVKKELIDNFKNYIQNEM